MSDSTEEIVAITSKQAGTHGSNGTLPAELLTNTGLSTGFLLLSGTKDPCLLWYQLGLEVFSPHFKDL